MLRQKLIQAAKEASTKAYAPYSHFQVGAALLTDSDEIFVGCNVECGVPIGICAERVALVGAVVHGHQSFKELLIYTSTSQQTPPCGVCRQMLKEFCTDITISSTNAALEVISWNLDDLLPETFVAFECGAFKN